MQETSKSIMRRSGDARFATRWLIGAGIDIGAGQDTIGNYGQLFPLMTSLRSWDLPDGDAMLMEGVADDSFDFVHSSHCLEHLVDPQVALAHWIRICKPGGHLVIMIPDEDMYEQGIFPSTFNDDHKWTFTTGKRESWSPRSINVMDLLSQFTHQVSVQKMEVLDACFLQGLVRFDQTVLVTGESAIEIVLRKRRPEEIARKGRYPDPQTA
ncbi:methyltransferase domain-containing protein [Caulobacter sp. NIBR2454]|uniref:methyltransferase domain-containing protein n=1 Tax=Caulobacter sp. NIBR2454 TaxID=3015996 RepID=UPI0022B62760|nr:methyltransferase domain-containing protein [Caulobacter sp. NIBR2454]